MAEDSFNRYLVLPELRLLKAQPLGRGGLGGTELIAEKVSELEVCPRCATPCRSVYDRRWVRLKDDPLRTRQTFLRVLKRRFCALDARSLSPSPCRASAKATAPRSVIDGGCCGPVSTSAI